MKKSVEHSLFVLMVISAVHPAHSIATTAMNIIDVADGCPDSSWTPHNNSCYLHEKSTTDFFRANDSCMGLEAHLVSIGSEDEDKFIWKYIRKQPIWIGLYRPTSEPCNGNLCQNWMWTDGSVLGYSEWFQRLANNTVQCAYLNDKGYWDHSYLCSEPRGYVCEQIREFPTTTTEPVTMSHTNELANPTYSVPGNVVPTAKSTGENKDDDIPIFIGCAVGGLAFVAILIVVAVVLYKRHRKSELGETNGGFVPNQDESDTCAHSGAVEPESVYAEAVKKKDRPGSESAEVHENPLYGKSTALQ